MAKISRESLMSLETYAKARNDFRSRIIAHKKNRTVEIGDHVILIFEDELTMRYQVQEMLRAERIFEEQGIQDELDAYNPLVPDGHNWKATMMIQYADPIERKDALAGLIGVEDKVWVAIEGYERVFAIADEDMERENDDKTSAVHFLRFELTPPMIAKAKQGAPISIGVDHGNYCVTVSPLSDGVRASLADDLVA